MRKKIEEAPPPLISMDYVSRGVAGKFTVQSLHSDGLSVTWTANDYDWTVPGSYSYEEESRRYGGMRQYQTGWQGIFRVFTVEVDALVLKKQEEFFTAKATPAHHVACCCGCRKACNEV